MKHVHSSAITVALTAAQLLLIMGTLRILAAKMATNDRTEGPGKALGFLVG